MSWDVDLIKELEDGLDEINVLHEVGNYTYNVSKMYSKAMGGFTINHLHGKKAIEAVKILQSGIIEMSKNPNEYKKLNPENGWGSYEGAKRFLKDIMNACLDYPESIVYVS
jgi:hypothetical protein